MENYSKANYEQLIHIIKETYGFDIDFINSEYICEFIYAGEMPMFRLLYVANKRMIAISFHVGISKTDAFDILHFVREQMPLVQISSEYIVNDVGETLFEHDAYLELERQIEARAVNKDPGYTEYKPDHPVTILTQEAVYEASHPEGQKQAKIKKEHQRWFAKFKWDD